MSPASRPTPSQAPRIGLGPIPMNGTGNAPWNGANAHTPRQTVSAAAARRRSGGARRAASPGAIVVAASKAREVPARRGEAWAARPMIPSTSGTGFNAAVHPGKAVAKEGGSQRRWRSEDHDREPMAPHASQKGGGRQGADEPSGEIAEPDGRRNVAEGAHHGA